MAAKRDSDNPNPEATKTTGSTTPPEGAPLADPANPYAGAEVITPGPLGGPESLPDEAKGDASTKG